MPTVSKFSREIDRVITRLHCKWTTDNIYMSCNTLYIDMYIIRSLAISKHTNTNFISFQHTSVTNPTPVSWSGPDKGCLPHQETGRNRRCGGSWWVIADSGDNVLCWCRIQTKWPRFRGTLRTPDICSNSLSDWLSIRSWLAGFKLVFQICGKLPKQG